MASPFLVILLGTIDLAVGMAIGWFLARPEQADGTSQQGPFRSVLDTLKSTLAGLRDISLHTSKLSKNIGELKELAAAPTPDPDGEERLFASGERLVETLQYDLDHVAAHIQRKLEEVEARFSTSFEPPQLGEPDLESHHGPSSGDCAPHSADEASIPEPIVEIIEQLKESHSAESERRTVPRYQTSFPIVVLPLDERLQPAGRHFQAVTRDISTSGISYFHSTPAPGRLWLVELCSDPVYSKRVLVETVRCEQFGSIYITVGRFIAQVPPQLAMNAAIAEARDM